MAAAGFSTVQAVRATAAANALGVEQEKTLEALGIAEAAEAEQRELRKTAEQRKVEADRMSAKLLQANNELAHNLYVSKIFQATAHLGLEDHAKAQDVLASISPELHNWETRYLSQVAHGTPLTIAVSGDLVRAPRFSPDGKWIVAGSDQGVVRFWDADSGKERKAFQIHEAGYFVDLAISPSGDRVASFATDEVKVWDPQTGQVQLTLQTVGRLGFSPDGARLITSGENGDGTGKIKVWNVRDGELLTSIERKFCWQAVFSPDGKSLVAGSGEGEIGHSRLTVWDATTGEERFSVDAGPLVYGIAWSPDGDTIASGGAIGSIKLWDAQSGELRHSIKAHVRGKINSLEFSPDANWLVSGGDDKTVKIWNAETGELNLTLKGHRHQVAPVSFSPDGSRIVSGSNVVPGNANDTTAKVWELVTRKRPRVITAHEGEWVHALNFDTDATRMVSGGSDHSVRVWDVVTGNLIRSLQGHEGWVNDVAFAPDGTSVFSCSVDGSIRIWDLNGETSDELQLGSSVSCIALNPDGTKLASGSDAGTVVVWDTENWTRVLTLRHAPHVHALAWSRAGNLLASGSRVDRDDTASIKIWDAAKGAEIVTIPTRTFQVNGLAFSPDRKRIVGCGVASNFKIWDVETGEELVDFRGHQSQISDVLFSSDGSRAISASADETVRIWDAQTGENLLTLDELPAGYHSSLALSPDNRWVCCGTYSRLKLWDAPLISAEANRNSYEPWAEDAAIRKHHVPIWHRREAERSEQEEDWFAARFHLSKLISDAPADQELSNRLKKAESAYNEVATESRLLYRRRSESSNGAGEVAVSRASR